MLYPKKIQLAILLAVMLPVFSCIQVFGQTFDNISAYLDYISAKNTEITSNHMSYTSAAAHVKSARKVEKRRIELINSNLDAINKLKVMPGWKGDVSYRDSVVAYYKILYHILKEDYAKIVDLEDIAEQSYDAMEAYLKVQEVASEKLEAASDRLNNEFKIFAAKYNVTIVDGGSSELSKKIEIANKVFEYKKELFLLFFKCNNQEKYLIEAQNKKDMNAMEQNRSSLEKYATENLQKLEGINSYNGDNSLVLACKTALQFYLKEAKEDMLKVQEYMNKQAEFAKLSKAMEAKKGTATQAEIDNYNKKVNEINAAVASFNAANAASNKARTEVNNGWNNACDAFLDKHIPKYVAPAGNK